MVDSLVKSGNGDGDGDGVVKRGVKVSSIKSFSSFFLHE